MIDATHPARVIPVRQFVGIIILCVIAYVGWQQLTASEPPSTGDLATQLTTHVNDTARFEGRADRVRAVACKSNGGNFFTCRGQLVTGADVIPVSWSVDTTGGHVRATPR